MANMEQVLNTINLDNEQYFQLTKAKISIFDEKLSDLPRFDTILIKAPAVIDITKYNTFPILEIMQNDDTREWMVPEFRNLIAVVFDNQRNKLYTGPARKEKKRMDFSVFDHPEEIPQDINTTGFSTGCELFDLRDALGIPWQKSNVTVTMLCFDWLSNSINVTLFGKNNNAGNIQPSVLSVLKHGIMVKGNVLFNEQIAQPILNFSLSEDANTIISNKLNGTFLFQLNENDIFKIDDMKAAIIPIYFLLIKKNIDWNSPIIGKWHIRAEIPDNDRKYVAVQGNFSFQINDLIPDLKTNFFTPNKYCCYMIAQGKVFGPVKINVMKQ